MSHLNVYIMNKVRKLLLVCGCFLGSMSLSAEVTSGSDFEILMQKIRQDFSKNPSIDEALSFYREEPLQMLIMEVSSVRTGLRWFTCSV